MAAHPDGSGRAFLYTQDGKISLASLPARGSGAALQIDGDGAVPFLDLTGRALVLIGLALHPEFVANGRFFVSYACDSIASPACGGAATAAGAGNGSTRPWRYQLVVQEFTAKGVDYGMPTQAAPKRIFAMGLPELDASNQQRAGQIFFRPGHGFLYLVTGHGGSGDVASSPFAGKIIRFDIDRTPGYYEPQIFATGLLDPRGCSYDSERPSYLYCAGVDEQQNEQEYLISGTAANNSASAVAPVIIRHGRPTAGEAPSIIGGLVFRGPADPFLTGRYVYIYGSSMWVAQETPTSNGLYEYSSARIPNVRCSGTSPVPCGGVGIAGSIVSLGQDNSMDAFIFATGGIYRVIPPGLCIGASPPRAPPLQMPSWLIYFFEVIIMSVISGGGIYWCLCCRRAGRGGGGEAAEGEGQRPATTNSWIVTWICCCSRGVQTNDQNNAAPTGAQGSTGTQAELANIS